MKMRPMIDYIQRNKMDDFNTPQEAVLPLLKYLDTSKIYWECTDDGSSGITQVLKEHNIKVVSTHIKNGFDFLRNKPDFDFDVIITNPPFSKKDQFLQRAYELGKPFCFLLPLTALGGVKRGEMFKKYGVELLVLSHRIDFTGKKAVWFNVAWFCWKILPEKLIIV